MYVVYADELFLENLIIDYILLLVTSRLAGIRARRLRILAAAISGGVYAVLAALSGASFLVSWAFKIAVGLLMVMLVFGASDRLLRVCLIFFGVSAAFAGAVMAASIVRGDGLRGAFLGQVSFGSLLLSFALCYVLFAGVFRAVARHRMDGGVTRLTVTFRGRKTVLQALLDTGNSLSDPITGLGVAVATLEALSPLFDSRVTDILRSFPDPSEALLRLTDAGIYSFFLVPYRSVGVSDGMLLAFRPDSVRHGQRELSVLIAVSPEDIGSGAGYSAVIGLQEVS